MDFLDIWNEEGSRENRLLGRQIGVRRQQYKNYLFAYKGLQTWFRVDEHEERFECKSCSDFWLDFLFLLKAKIFKFSKFAVEIAAVWIFSTMRNSEHEEFLD